MRKNLPIQAATTTQRFVAVQHTKPRKFNAFQLLINSFQPILDVQCSKFVDFLYETAFLPAGRREAETLNP